MEDIDYDSYENIKSEDDSEGSSEEGLEDDQEKNSENINIDVSENPFSKLNIETTDNTITSESKESRDIDTPSSQKSTKWSEMLDDDDDIIEDTQDFYVVAENAETDNTAAPSKELDGEGFKVVKKNKKHHKNSFNKSTQIRTINVNCISLFVPRDYKSRNESEKLAIPQLKYL